MTNAEIISSFWERGYSVRFIDGPLEVSGTNIAETWPEDHLIRIRSDRGPDAERIALIHELCHVSGMGCVPQTPDEAGMGLRCGVPPSDEREAAARIAAAELTGTGGKR